MVDEVTKDNCKEDTLAVSDDDPLNNVDGRLNVALFEEVKPLDNSESGVARLEVIEKVDVEVVTASSLLND